MNTLLSSLSANFRLILACIALAGLAIGSLLWASGAEDRAAQIWCATTVPVLAALIAEIVSSLREGQFGLDVVAALSMTAALAFGEPLAGNVVALMYSGGQLLERFAEGRARREMTALLGRVARTAMRYNTGGLSEVAIEAISPGDRILVRKGEVVPVDGRVAKGIGILDVSALTGEPTPVRLSKGGEVLSGSTSVGDAFDVVATRPAAESTYANIVRLVESAQQSKAPMVRLADRYAIWFLLFTVVLASAAWWATGDRIRALAVLVVATPCPLILAVPVAIISGMSRTARLGALVKHGGAIEALAQVRTAVLDKTGTLTLGRARVEEIRTTGHIDGDELLRLAASLDQASGHITAEALVVAAQERGLQLSMPSHVAETAGTGIEGMVDGRRLIVGGSSFVRDRSRSGNPRDLRDGLPEGSVVVAVSVDGVVAGIVVLADHLRSDAKAVLDEFRQVGIRRIVLASGDRQDVVTVVGRQLAVDAAFGELTPEQKVEIVVNEGRGASLMMVGDGVNDAPALAAADVGVAMGARGAAASSEAADVVLLVDDLGPLAAALAVARRTRTIALQSVTIGLGLSVLAMGVAALGYLPPVKGALVQEVIDVAVILNALRALGGRSLEGKRDRSGSVATVAPNASL
ncbi:heavy metal translocating P-type ATPase [Rhizobiaceae bacterium n13]|uniref:P-type Zn(2+) transporter n=1 Tax=Ferirhizobium litorale TaxID=2927786 RepID=A0AAE3QBF6_9HYPH|nr:heavy metal translocating P-type ATPase [Fererhizobium litorale]MDI7861718.1 heavy metal translocating P-type ATPase [Fererhizobium litorale]MDI7921940.1 heavy metal translocating P-type ATPase [Fererhizobium litorale]